LASPTPAGAADATAPQAPERQYTHAEITAAIAVARRIVTPDGVEELIKIPLGGTDQWISVRGQHRANPILLLIHGGPASPEMPTSWWFQRDWEEFFTVVEWDQRGAGKSYGASDPEGVRPTLSLERITSDAAELVQFLRDRYAKPKLFVAGHSWGSVVGLNLAHRHPEWLYAYVGMGQVIGGVANERAGYEMTLAEARARRNAAAIRELEALAPYPEADGTLSVDKIGAERKWSVEFGGLTRGRSDIDYYYGLVKFAPEYTPADAKAINEGSALSLAPLVADMMRFDFTDVLDWRCPIVMFEGRYDSTTPSSVTAQWLARVRAPHKQLVWFENSAHMMIVEEPGQLLMHLVQDVRPLAGLPR
jgi:pimeloyl-ACP methyl ester carboxylesterase